MTKEKRDEMFAKDFLTVEDICELLGVCYQKGTEIIKEIRFHSDRLGIKGRVHVQDYIDYYRLDPGRYGSITNTNKQEERTA